VPAPVDPSSLPLVAEIAPAAPTSGGDGIFDYLVPPHLAGEVRPGARVTVPLAGRTVEGYVLGLKRASEVPPEKLKDVTSVIDPRPVYPPALLELAVWAARRYLCQPGEVLAAAVPTSVRGRTRTRRGRSRATDTAGGADRVGTRAGGEDGQQGKGGDERHGSEFVLSPAQAAALAAIRESLVADGGAFLLHGVTGSGKTEVFLRAAAETLALGRQVLLLVPEVSLVPQTVQRVRDHLGSARVAVAHSYLGGRERADYWEKVVSGQADVVVGARSAVFAPLQRLGLIVLDEEHEDSYKQEEMAHPFIEEKMAVGVMFHVQALLFARYLRGELDGYPPMIWK